MNYETIEHLKKYARAMFGPKLNGREVQLICDYLEIAYVRGRLDELKNIDGRLANTPQGTQDAAH